MESSKNLTVTTESSQSRSLTHVLRSSGSLTSLYEGKISTTDLGTSDPLHSYILCDQRLKPQYSGHIIEIFDNVVTQVELLVGQQIQAVKKRLGKPLKVT